MLCFHPRICFFFHAGPGTVCWVEANCKGVSFPSESGVACCYHEGGASFAGYDGCINCDEDARM